MKTITIREWTRFAYRYLDEGVYNITKSGKPFLTITVEKNVTTKAEEIEIKPVTTSRIVTTYGCGCERGPSNLCPKHSRV
jgi:hypothetical protein